MLTFAIQIDTAIDAATREWTIAAFAIFVWLLTCGFFIWLLRSMARRRDKEIADLVESRNLTDDGWRKDLQAQITKRGEDAERVERGLGDSAAAVREQTAAVADQAARITALESRCEAIDRRTEQILSILDRRGHPRDGG